jgi:hypothetical protein
VGQKTGWATDVNGATETEWQRKGRKRNTGQLFAGLAATDFEGGLVLHFGQEHQNIRTPEDQNIRKKEGTRTDADTSGTDADGSGGIEYRMLYRQLILKERWIGSRVAFSLKGNSS